MSGPWWGAWLSAPVEGPFVEWGYLCMFILEKNNTLIGAPTMGSPLLGPPGGASGGNIIIKRGNFA